MNFTEDLSFGCFIFPLRCVEHLAPVSDRAYSEQSVYLLLLLQDAGDRHVRRVRIQYEGALLSRKGHHWGTTEVLFGQLEGLFSLFRPMEVQVRLDQSVHWFHQFTVPFDEIPIVIGEAQETLKLSLVAEASQLQHGVRRF